jgi:hypothetical protein
MQILGKTPAEAIFINHFLCEDSWYGKSVQRYPAGMVVLTKAVVIGGGRTLEEEVKISLPEGEVRESIRKPGQDPTLTGSFLITAESFGGQFPASLSVEIMWKNDTPFIVYSPDKSRQLSINYMPLGKDAVQQ